MASDLEQKLQDLEQKILGSIRQEFQEFRDEIRQLREENQQLKQKVNNLEQYSRRNSIRIFGIEETENESCNSVVKAFLKDQLGVIAQEEHFDRIHRVGKKTKDTRVLTRSSVSNKPRPRPLIVKFTSYRYKREVLKVKRALKGSGKFIAEDLTKENYELLKKASEENKVKAAWTADGRIVVQMKSGEIKTITNIKEVK